jgi:hypothetical protein
MLVIMLASTMTACAPHVSAEVENQGGEKTMPCIPRHQDISMPLSKYETDKIALKPDAASQAFMSIIDELNN